MNQYQPYRPLVQSVPAKPSAPRHHRWLAAAVLLAIILAVIGLDAAKRADARAAADNLRRQQLAAGYQRTVQFYLENHPELKASVAITDMRTGGTVIGEKGRFDAASTAKVITAVAYLQQVESGDASLKQLIGGRTALQQLQLMLQQSDDSAWHLFNDKLGHPRLQALMTRLGLNSYDAEANSVSSGDMNHFMADLISGKLLTPEHTGLILSYMQHTNYEDFISPAVPKNYSLYHKVGIDADELNDTAIIKAADGQTIVLTIFTDGRGSYNWPARAVLIQRITSQALRAYFE